MPVALAEIKQVALARAGFDENVPVVGQLRSLLESYAVQKVIALPPEEYADFLWDLQQGHSCRTVFRNPNIP